MTTNLVSRTAAVALAFLLLASACSGGDDSGPSAEELAADPANAPIEQIDEASGGVAEGPIRGLLTVQPSFGFGVFDVDRATGQATAVPGIASVETVDRNRDVVVGDGAAFSLGATPREGQTFASDVSVVKVDYATGQVSQLVALGFDRETDDSESLMTFKIEAVAGGSVVVSSGSFGSDDVTFTVYNTNTGDVTASFPKPVYEFTSDSGTCGGGIANLIGLSDGRVAGTSLGSPAFVDLESGEIELVIGCDEPDPELIQFITPDEISDFAIFNQGPAPTPEQIEQLLISDVNPEWDFVEGDGDLWWIESNTRQVDDVQVTIGGVVQFDLASGQIEKIHPLGTHLGEYIDCGPDSESCELSTMAQAQMRFIDGQLVIMDIRENGRLFTLDPATSALTVTELERGEGVDYTTADLLSGDPNAVWLETRRMTITKDDETGRSASGPIYIEHFDLAANQIDLSLAALDIFF